MPSKKINVNILDPKSLKKAIAELETMEKTINRKTDKFVRRCAETVADKAGMLYSSTTKDGDHDNEFAPINEKLGNAEYRVGLKGNSVLFIEFGTGITKSDSPEARAALQSGTVVGHGEYGLKRGANPNGWKYNGIKTYGLDAQTPVYTARKELKNEISKLADEEFKHWEK